MVILAAIAAVVVGTGAVGNLVDFAATGAAEAGAVDWSGQRLRGTERLYLLAEV